MSRRPRQGFVFSAAAGDTEARHKGGHEPELFLLLRRSFVVVVDELVDCLTNFRHAVVATTVVRAVHGVEDSPRQTERPRRCAAFGQ